VARASRESFSDTGGFFALYRYDSNKVRIKKLEFFMKENKKRIERSEGRIAK